MVDFKEAFAAGMALNAAKKQRKVLERTAKAQEREAAAREREAAARERTAKAQEREKRKGKVKGHLHNKLICVNQHVLFPMNLSYDEVCLDPLAKHMARLYPTGFIGAHG